MSAPEWWAMAPDDTGAALADGPDISGTGTGTPRAAEPRLRHHLSPETVRTLHALPLPVFMLDVRQAGAPIGLVNPAFVAVIGYEEDELYGRPLSMLHAPSTTREAAAEMDAGIANRQAVTADLMLSHKNGSTLPGRVSLAPVPAPDGSVVGLIGSQAPAAGRGPELAAWVATFTHDFNNLLQVMVGYAGLIAAAANKPEVDRGRIKRAAEALHIAGERLSVLVEGLAPLAGRPPS